MNAPRVVAGTAVLVLATFWAIVVLDSLSTIGLMVILVSPFVVLLAVGIYGITNGLSSPSQSRGSAARSARIIGPLGMAVLQMIAQGKNQEEIAAATSVSVKVVAQKIDTLAKAGFLSENQLSEKGFEALKGMA